jgi:LysR family transcriptional regulator, hydrogen peroxide-inducible genes activator
MELHQLRYAVAVADTGNFTRAAERSFVAQPSLSQQILNLEAELGHKLFHRLGRKAVPTEAGNVFLQRARRILAEVEDAAKEMRDDAIGRRIVVGAIPTVGPYLLPQLIDRCHTELPNLLINTREDFRVPLLKGVVDGDLDMAIVTMPLDDHRVSVEPLFSEPLLLVVGQNHPLARKPEIEAQDLASETFVLLGDSSSLTSQIHRFCGDNNFEPKIGHRCLQVKSVKALVGLGAGISILPQVSRSADDRKTLVYRSLSGHSAQREIGLVRHLQRYQSRGAEQFIALLRSSVKADQKNNAEAGRTPPPFQGS